MILTYSEIVGMHLMAQESPQIFIQKPSIASSNQECNHFFIRRKIIKNMLVIEKEKHNKKIFCVEYVAKL
jgi:hypothetical protein